jgi:pimeloyl-ACP methyl ester carboxylesterase
MELRERFIKTNGIKLHVVESGPEEGPLLLLLHGFPEFWYAWRKQIGYFAERGYLVAAPDQRGYNLSDKPAGIEAYKLDHLATDAVGLIDHYGRDRAYLAGHDWGASVAWWTAIKYPGRLEKLVILNVPHNLVMNANLKNNPKQARRSWYIFFFQLPEFPEKLAALDNYAWPINILETSSRPGAFTPADLEEYRKAFAQPVAFSAMVNWYRASLQVKNELLEDYTITVPTLILWGVKDRALVPEMAEESLKCCKQGRLIKFEQATHWLQHEEAEAVNREMEQFFAQSG